MGTVLTRIAYSARSHLRLKLHCLLVFFLIWNRVSILLLIIACVHSAKSTIISRTQKFKRKTSFRDGEFANSIGYRTSDIAYHFKGHPLECLHVHFTAVRAMDQPGQSTEAIQRMMTHATIVDLRKAPALGLPAWRFPPFFSVPAQIAFFFSFLRSAISFSAFYYSIDDLRQPRRLVDRALCGEVDARA